MNQATLTLIDKYLAAAQDAKDLDERAQLLVEYVQLRSRAGREGYKGRPQAETGGHADADAFKTLLLAKAAG